MAKSRIKTKATSWRAPMWGPTIVGFSPHKANLATYASNVLGNAELLKTFGTHKGGRAEEGRDRGERCAAELLRGRA